MQRTTLIAISDRKAVVDDSDLRRWAASLPISGVVAVQLREKDLCDRDLLAMAQQVRKTLPDSVGLVINGRPDIAYLCGADGVHLPANGLPIEPLRRRFGSSMIIGRSTHSVTEVRVAKQEGADYVFFGPVFETPAKLSFGPPLGLVALQEATAIGIPVFAVGGLSVDRVELLARAGAYGSAGIRIFQQGERAAEVSRAAQLHFKNPKNFDLSIGGRQSPSLKPA